ncbi:MAG TPA: flagellar biosynthesis protein FlhF [Phycisphaerae bacterium]|nr:flagellar biosynthesis protein FlhF [Phycisphaerae bacterium]
MNLKTYKAPTMAEALAEVKRDLGRDAVIVRTRNCRRGWPLGWLRRRDAWEVIASAHLDAPRPAPAGRYAPEPAADTAGKRPRQAPATGGAVAEDVGQIRSMVEALLAMQRASKLPDTGPRLQELRVRLVRQEVGEELADELIAELSMQLTGRQLAEDRCPREQLKSLIGRRVISGEPPRRPAANGRARVAMFIGPTGVGKTTTIAKLAANCRLRESKKVAMITIDTYRIAAVDQLKTYAELIEVPLHVVLTPGELAQAIESLRDCDVVLIDTAGRSQNDRLRLNQLSGFLRAAEADDVNLVIAAPSSRSAVASTLERFMPLGVNGIVMTKLDEAIALGPVLNVAAASKMPIRYVTTGQDVPDDISPTDPARLAECIVEGSLYVV